MRFEPATRGSEGDASPSWEVCEGAGPLAGAAKQVSELSRDGAWFKSRFPLQTPLFQLNDQWIEPATRETKVTQEPRLNHNWVKVVLTGGNTDLFPLGRA